MKSLRKTNKDLAKIYLNGFATELIEFCHGSICRPGSKPINVIVDALDECSQDEVHTVVRAFERSAAIAIARKVKLRLCWASRHFPLIKIRRCQVLQLENENTLDIASYVRSELQDSDIMAHDSDIVEKIVHKANGVFLWARLIMHRLLTAAEYEQKNSQDISNILETVAETHRPQMLLFFQWVVFAPNPLSLAEFGYAIEFSRDSQWSGE